MKWTLTLTMAALGAVLIVGALLSGNTAMADSHGMHDAGNESAEAEGICPMNIPGIDVDREKVGKVQGGVAFDFDVKGQANKDALRDKLIEIATNHPNSVLNLEQEPQEQGSGSPLAYSNVTYEARPGGGRLIFWTEDQSKDAVKSVRIDGTREAKNMNKTKTCSLDLLGQTGSVGSNTQSGRSSPEKE